MGGGQAPRQEAAQASPGAINVSGGQSQPRAASDVGDLLGKSNDATGVELQRRSPVITDARIRGQHVGQVVTWSDGGFFFPARQDLDTAVSKYDSSIIRDVIIVKGPYSALYGPGFSFLDIATYDTPRYEGGAEYHGSTRLGYQTNGRRYDGLQALWGGGDDWGFRISYGFRAGDDYYAGGAPIGPPFGTTYIVPSSYHLQPINYALGFNLSPDSKIEFKGLQLNLWNAEFAGVYFDIAHLETTAQSIRWVVENQEFFDRFVLDVWYNRTGANGNTLQGAKQEFLTTLLSGIFDTRILDRSDTRFTEMSRGYRQALSWGQAGCPRLTLGTDLNYINQNLTENIRYISADGVPVPEFFGSTEGTQTLGIPASTWLDPGVFAEISLPIGERMTLKTGGRGDWVQTDSDPRRITGNIPVFFRPPNEPVTDFDPIIFSVSPFNNDLDRSFGLWSAYVSMDYKIDCHLTALASFGFAQRPPTLTELYAAGPYIAVLQQGLDRLYGDPNLLPEKMKQLDLGLRANYSWFRGGITGFYAWVDDYITYDLLFGTSSASSIAGSNPIAQVVFTNTDRATLAGAEIYTEVDVTPWLTGFANTSYVEGRDLTHIDNRRDPFLSSSRRTIDTEPLPGISPLDSRVGLRVHDTARSPRWSVELGVRLVNHQDLVAASLLEVPTPGFTIWDLRGFWQVNDGLLLTAGVENIGDKFYREHLDPRAGFPTDLMFRPGTNAYVGMQWNY
jgi:outer membrane receptor protein involved in Fe transport